MSRGRVRKSSLKKVRDNLAHARILITDAIDEITKGGQVEGYEIHETDLSMANDAVNRGWFRYMKELEKWEKEVLKRKGRK